MPNKRELTRSQIEAVNEAAGLFRDRMVRLVELMEKQDEDTDGVEEAYKNAIEYVETNLPRLIRKSRDKMDFDDNLSASKIKESSIE